MKNKLILIGSICLLQLSSAQAQVAVSGDIGTTGLGAHISVPLKSNLNARFGLNYFSRTYSSSTIDANYDVKMKLNTFDALLDYFPMDGVFRVSGGLIYNGNKIEANAKPTGTGTYTLNGTTYSSATAGTINGNVSFKKIAPYVGIGWGKAIKGAGWGFSSDLGIMYQGSGSSSLTNVNCTAGAPTCAQLASDLAVESRSFSDSVNKLKLFPVLRVGVNYRF